MAEYVIISNGVVVNAIDASADFVSAHLSGAVTVDVTALDPRPGIGWAYEGGVFRAPVPGTPSGTIFSPTDFMRLFTYEEIGDCFGYASNTGLTADQQKSARAFIEYFRSASSVDVATQTTEDGVRALESMGLLATGRAAQILAART